MNCLFGYKKIIVILLFSSLILNGLALSPISIKKSQFSIFNQILPRGLKSIVYQRRESSKDESFLKNLADFLAKEDSGLNIIQHKYLQIGNIIAAIDLPEGIPGVILIWSGSSKKFKDTHPGFTSAKEKISNFEHYERQHFENILYSLKISFKKDSSQMFYYLSSEIEIERLKDLYSSIVEYQKNLKNGGEEAFKQDLFLLQDIYKKFKKYSPDMDDKKTHLLQWYYITEMLRRFLIDNKVPMAVKIDSSKSEKQKSSDFVTTTLNTYLRITFSFFSLTRAMQNQIYNQNDDQHFLMYQVSLEHLIRYSTMMSDWFKIADTKQSFNTITNEFMYFNYLLETLLYKYKFREVFNARPFDEGTNNYQEIFLRDLNKFLSPKGFKSIDSCFQVIRWIDKLTNMFGVYYSYVLNQAMQMDIHTQKETLTHLSNELVFWNKVINQIDFIYKKIPLKKVEKRYKGFQLKEFKDKLNKFHDDLNGLRVFIKNIHNHLIIFRTGVVENKNFDIGFSHIVQFGNASNMFHIFRMMSPDSSQSIYNDKEDYKELYKDVLKPKMISFFEEMNEILEDDKLPKVNDAISFLSIIDPRFFGQFLFWDQTWPENGLKQNSHFLKESLESKDLVKVQFSYLILAYQALFRSFSQNDSESGNSLDEAYNYFYKVFSTTVKVTKQRKKMLGDFDSGYQLDKLDISIDPVFQEVNRMVNFITHLLFDNNGYYFKPTTSMHEISDDDVITEEESILNAIQSDEVSKENKEEINWEIVIAISKYYLSLTSMQIPLISKIERNFLMLIDYGTPDQYLVSLLKSFLNDKHKYSLMYADYLKNYFSEHDEKLKLYPLTFSLVVNYLKNIESLHFENLACYASMLTNQQRYKEGYKAMDFMLANHEAYQKYIEEKATPSIPDMVFDNYYIHPLKDAIKRYEKFDLKLRERIGNITLTWINGKNHDVNKLKRLLQKTYSNSKLHAQINWQNDDEKNSMIQLAKEDQTALKTSYSLLLYLIEKMDFSFKPQKGHDILNNTAEFWNEKFNHLKVIRNLAKTLLRDINDKSSVDVLSHDDELYEFLNIFSKLNKAFIKDRNYIKSKTFLKQVTGLIGIDAALLNQQVNQSNTGNKKKAKKKKGKKNKAKINKNQKSIKYKKTRLFNSFPVILQNATVSFLREINKTIEQDILQKKQVIIDIKNIITSLYEFETQDVPLNSLTKMIKQLEIILSEHPHILTANLFEQKENTKVYQYANQFVDRNIKNRKLLVKCKTLKTQSLSHKNNLFQDLKKITKRSVLNLKELNSYMDDLTKLYKLDQNEFKIILINIAYILKENISEIIPQLVDVQKAYIDGITKNHHFLNLSQLAKINNSSKVLVRILKLIYKNDEMLKLCDSETINLIQNCYTFVHKIKVMHYLKIFRLKLSVLNDVEEAKHEEIVKAFMSQDQEKEYEGSPEVDYKNEGQMSLKLSQLPNFLKGAEEHKKMKKAKRTFEEGDRLVFFTSYKDYLEMLKKGAVPKFEVVSVDTNEIGEALINLKLVNPEEFPHNIKMQTLIDNYIPVAGLNDKKAYFYINKSDTIKDRLRLIDQMVFDLSLQYKNVKDPLLESDKISLSANISGYQVLNTLLGFNSMDLKIQAEKDLLACVSLDEAPSVLNEAQAKGFVHMQKGKDNKALQSKVQIFQAPGGTGKSRLLKEAVKKLFPSSNNILITSSTHKATDNIGKDLYDTSLKEVIFRYGSEEASKKMDPMVRNYLWHNRDSIISKDLFKKIYLGSSTGFKGDSVLNKILREKEKSLSSLKYDFIFYDEAGMDAFDRVIYLISQMSSDETILVLLGDIMQLSAFGLSFKDIERIKMYLGDKVKKYDGLNLNKTLFSPWILDQLTMSPLELFYDQFGYNSHYLTENYRSTDAIVQLLNLIGYTDQAHSMISKRKSNIPVYKQVEYLEGYDNLIKTFKANDEYFMTTEGKKIKGAYINKKEIFLILDKIEKDFRDFKDLTGNQITIISPYNGQNKLFEMSLWAFAFLGEMKRLNYTRNKEIFYPDLKLEQITELINDLIITYGRDKRPIDFNQILQAEYSKTYISQSVAKKLYKELDLKLPLFIPRNTKSINISRLTNFDLIDISDLKENDITDNEEDKDLENVLILDITTVNKSQGRENRAIYFSAVRRNLKGILGFFFSKKGLGMIITALGRAIELLRVAADEKTWNQAYNLRPQNEIQRYEYACGKEAAAKMILYIKVARNLRKQIPFNLKKHGISKNHPAKKAA